MKTISNFEAAEFESTYAMIVRSEEKQRSRFEIVVYVLLIASALFALSQFSREAVKMPFGIAHARMSASPSAQWGI